MFTERDLALMRQTQEDALNDKVNITRRVLHSDGFGGYEQTDEVIVLTDVPARVELSLNQAYGTGLGRDLDVEKWLVRMPYGTPVQDEDIIEWGDYLLKVETIKPQTWPTCVTVNAERIKG